MAFVCEDLLTTAHSDTFTSIQPLPTYITQTFTSFITEVLPGFHHNLNQSPSSITSTNSTLNIPGLLFSLLSPALQSHSINDAL
ncbi:hypothetical protein K435DRAFT_782666 [Dendrothele bispora CBS 962.96]|uniref:Uncharacterized protein n=1 Tax=Dendrothele bispora (strain CBS 962.96) TaxID=1314807 RepID=A0A4S8LE91_DENBC|nr:hypothetical protein K435DRAFT_782666 [Dendrothele bispora CBS 962.96]